MASMRQTNLEIGMPYVDQAIRKLALEIQTARTIHASVLKVIHGYGSSGTGGKIRTAVRRRLEEMHGRGEIRAYIPGETFSIFDPVTREAFLRCAELRQDRDLDRYNNGVTFIVL
ncbi:hypothetical protein H8790_02470 [Oscillibacter hominis]|uniref:Smr domain-containing protein n=1 Tax=Oscillibacter hominis TaxID=2763056 RepID=A0A7G9B5V1_9FIRM|nr:Smr/MutS family protein [Oscillibacter hominis]QNL44932.1 hypothetical protein H8790_02470 [Oscillibacter hominis]